ncbi:glycosyltransferase 8 domain-containing protein 2 [Lates japonicus]|uniref:Glycosyltransferase 8 domain-containing protein 2 n=1 Tax=Lates japonicus TaxID=270547 RepID=A0AAD3NP33_LATJO|nr:glycosyltransferase 8 domain-containing protein 2 [Lates japonicus]
MRHRARRPQMVLVLVSFVHVDIKYGYILFQVIANCLTVNEGLLSVARKVTQVWALQQAWQDIRSLAPETSAQNVDSSWSPDARYSESFLQEAHLLHWNGPFKPWNYPAVHLDRWEKWFIPDPSGKFSLVRPDSDS